MADANFSTVVSSIPPYKAEKGEEYMNSNMRKHFAQLLQAWKEELLEEFERTVTLMRSEAGENYSDPTDRATKEEGDSFQLRIEERKRKLLKKIEEALERVNHEDFGYCKDCDAEIGVGRLEARPMAEMCIDCKTLQEMKEKQGDA